MKRNLISLIVATVLLCALTMGLAPQVAATAETASGAFADVPQDSYYADAVKWAVQNGVTNGTTATTFSPGNTCTRAQVVTFFWRNAGQPEPSSEANPFSDVQEGSYYYNAVLWAVEQGITNGTSATTFSPNNSCTYAHVITFLWRLKSEDKDSSGGEAWYTVPAAWANLNGLLTGTQFSPNEPCPRSDIVTYLYRSRADKVDVFMSMEDEDPAYAVISATNFDGDTLWSHTTGQYERTELDRIQEIGAFGDQYLYVAGGSVVALDLHTGEVLWRNEDFGGAGANYCMGTNGVLYLCGYYGPDFFGVDVDGNVVGRGNTVGRVATFSDDYWWAYAIQRVDESHMSVSMAGPDEGNAFLVDLRDFSYSGPFDEKDSAVAPKVGPFLSGLWFDEGEGVSAIDVTQVGDLYLFDVSWKGGYRWSFCGKWENGAVRYTNGLYSHRDFEFSWGQTGKIEISGNSLIWTDGSASDSDPVVYWR